jgi:hypothetical protein
VWATRGHTPVTFNTVISTKITVFTTRRDTPRDRSTVTLSTRDHGRIGVISDRDPLAPIRP